MDAHNLATMLGPNILRLSKTEKDKFIVENLERAEERCDVILVVRQLIENYEHIFQVRGPPFPKTTLQTNKEKKRPHVLMISGTFSVRHHT